MIEFLWFIALTCLAVGLIRLGSRLWKKEAAARKALAKRISDDAEALVKESEAWLAKEWNRRFKGGAE